MVSSAVSAPEPKNVVILGGGIIGVSIAYQLSKRGICPLIVERSKIAAAGDHWQFV